MKLETLLIYGLRLWLAGAMYTGVFLVQVGPFVLAGLGFAGWQGAQSGGTRQQRSRKSRTTAPDETWFTLR